LEARSTHDLAQHCRLHLPTDAGVLTRYTLHETVFCLELGFSRLLQYEYGALRIQLN
jgi:hypothetical protein